MKTNHSEKNSLLDSIKPLLDSEWKKLVIASNNRERMSDEAPESFWIYSISPALPSAWPPHPSLFLIYYVYAMNQAPHSLADAIYVAAPWAFIELDSKKKSGPTLKILSSKIRKLGIQGVRPLSREETTVYNNKESVEAYLGTLAILPDETNTMIKKLREYYCTWFKLNSITAEEIRIRHTKFFDWLGCN